jgi:hypothetical protein
LKLPSPPVGGVGVGGDGRVVGGVDEEGELPSPQEEVKTSKLAAATAIRGIRLRRANMKKSFPECTKTGGSKPHCTPLHGGRQAFWGVVTSFDAPVT